MGWPVSATSGRFSGDGVPAASPGQCRQRSASAASPWPGRGLQRQRASGAYPSHHRSLALFRGGVPEDLGTVASARHSYRPPSGEADHEGKRPSGAAAARPAGRDPHDGTIVTDKVDQVWGTDMTQTVTIGEGRAYVFIAVDHCSGEFIGTHASSGAGRWEALEPIRQGVTRHFGCVGPNTALGLILRHDHGSNYMSDDFQSEIKCFGITSSPAFVRQPEGNGVAERAIRTLKEQLLWVRHFATVEELRRALAAFAAEYNAYGCGNDTATRRPIRSGPNRRPLKPTPPRRLKWRHNQRNALSQNRAPVTLFREVRPRTDAPRYGLLTKSGWRAMPRRPRSPPALTCSRISRAIAVWVCETVSNSLT